MKILQYEHVTDYELCQVVDRIILIGQQALQLIRILNINMVKILYV
jgi:hypothetical protein